MERLSRRRLLQGCAVGAAGLAGCPARSGTEPACVDDELVHESDADLSRSASWPTYQYDAANTGHDPDASGPKRDVEVAWRYPACTSTSSGAVVHDGKVAAGGLVVNGRTGRPVGGEWEVHARTPTFANERLYVGANDLLARDGATGELDWTFETESDSGGLGEPTVVDGRVYVSGQSDDPTVYAVDASAGQEDWRFEPAAGCVYSPAVADSMAFIVARSSTIYAVDAATGDEQWRRSPDMELAYSMPVVADGTLYLGSIDGTILAIDVSDGSDRWRRDLGSRPTGLVAVADGTLFVPSSSERALFALSTSDGHELWKRSSDSASFGLPVIADDVVYVGASRTLYAIEASTGDERWQFETRRVEFGDTTRGEVNASFAVADRIVYVATNSGDLYALIEP